MQCRYKSVGKLSSGHQAAIMKLAIDDTDTADGNICVVTGAKDHYVKVSAVRCYINYTDKCCIECRSVAEMLDHSMSFMVHTEL